MFKKFSRKPTWLLPALLTLPGIYLFFTTTAPAIFWLATAEIACCGFWAWKWRQRY